MRSLILALAASLAIASPAVAEDPAPAPLSPAQHRADSLDRLFASLHRDSDGPAAARIEKNIWDLWMSSDSPTAEVLLRQASKAMDEGAPAEALKILDTLIDAHPDFAEAWNRRATLYFLMKDYDRSLADIERVLELEPRHFGALAGRGMIYQRQKNYTAAIDAFREALRMNPAMEGPKAALKELERLEQSI
ncbi:MAG: tetratricopeptide repeat protein [Alphaproteobacteria bacterium]|nr:tetratricopeptide repeat protein [Alphaproteobacteria bacterium]